MANLHFADLSNNNPEYEPAAYAHAGHVIIALKASEGVGFADPVHRHRALLSGLHRIQVIHYHFGRPDLGHSGKDEADWFLHVTAGLLGPYDYVVYDGERALNGSFGLDPAHCRAFDDRIRERTRFHTILYGSASVLRNAPEDCLAHPLRRDWDADYSTERDANAPGHVCVIRQHTDGVFGPGPHEFAGIGRCDGNVLRGEFGRAVLKNAGR